MFKNIKARADFSCSGAFMEGVWMHLRRLIQGEDGFTLVEMMVVLLILGILVGLVTASFVFSLSASKETACKANLKIIREAVSRYYAQHEDFPATLQDLIPDYIDSETGTFCPESGETYDYDPATGEVHCTYHTDY
jgi:prepilin-type N-terminal cleavage/methylation domain-containing protein